MSQLDLPQLISLTVDKMIFGSIFTRTKSILIREFKVTVTTCSPTLPQTPPVRLHPPAAFELGNHVISCQ
jgi:hypothetical protein